MIRSVANLKLIFSSRIVGDCYTHSVIILQIPQTTRHLVLASDRDG